MPSNRIKPKKKIALVEQNIGHKVAPFGGSRCTDWPRGPIWHILGAKVDSAVVQNGLGEEGCRTAKAELIVHSGTGEEVP